ncbi:MAG: hypothetical protein AABW49_02455 [Nanoarchaeota archaeon]
MKKISTADTIYYQPIHLIGSDQAAAEFFSTHRGQLLDAVRLIRKKELPIQLGLKATVVLKKYNSDGWGVSQQGMDSALLSFGQLVKDGIDVNVDPRYSGPTRSMFQVLFDQGLIGTGFKAICTGDLDQFPPSKNLENVIRLSEETIAHESVLGVGKRDVPVVLAANQENAYLRRIFEGVINISIKNTLECFEKELYAEEPLQQLAAADPAYMSHGDFVTGVYLLNPSAENYGEFVRGVVDQARSRGFFGFEDEYLMVHLAAACSNLDAIYFNSVANPFSPMDIKTERNKIVTKQIQAPLEKLAGTFVHAMLPDGMIIARERLTEFYPREQIDEVIGYMKQAIDDGSELNEGYS